MGRAPCCSKVGLHRGPWTPREDTLLTKYIEAHGEGHWRSLPKNAGLLRCGKSCRLRWMNYLRPDIKRGNITSDEDDLIIRLHTLLGNRWSLIAGRLPGRTDNEIKNYWNTHLSKKIRSQGTEPKPKESKRRKNQKPKSGNKKKAKEMMSKKESPAGPAEKPKVHQPRPTRVTSFLSLPRIESNDSFNSSTITTATTTTTTTMSTLSSRQDGGGCCGGGGGGFGGGGDDADQVPWQYNGVVFSVGEDHKLETLYEEYLQALLRTDHHHDQNQLELDTFAESLLI